MSKLYELSETKYFNIVFIGRAGAGKSTTINSIFHLDRPTDEVVACTKYMEACWLPSDEYCSNFDAIQVTDLPGIAESLEADEKYFQFYKIAVSLADCIVWCFQANTRGYRADQEMLIRLESYIRSDVKFIICLNHIDKVYPSEEWNGGPSAAQMVNIEQKIEYTKDRFSEVFNPSKVQVVACASLHGYGIDVLQESMFRQQCNVAISRQS